jgi:glycosyltransferase involved in cell wall biosynthesis
MVHSVPVIIGKACGISALVEGRAGIVVAPEADALTAALQILLTDRSLYERMQTGCRTVTAELRWDNLAAKMAGYYAQVLDSGGAA